MDISKNQWRSTGGVTRRLFFDTIVLTPISGLSFKNINKKSVKFNLFDWDFENRKLQFVTKSLATSNKVCVENKDNWNWFFCAEKSLRLNQTWESFLTFIYKAYSCILIPGCSLLYLVSVLVAIASNYMVHTKVCSTRECFCEPAY